VRFSLNGPLALALHVPLVKKKIPKNTQCVFFCLCVETDRESAREGGDGGAGGRKERRGACVVETSVYQE
jgi:hypothetical protein